jgi:RNA polymerase sigma factor (TIGR02999 family)
MARGQLRREHLSTLEPTALVHEAYLRLVDQKRAEFHDRAHFFAIAATVMRRVLVDQARARLADKRQHMAVPLAVATDLAASRDRDPELLDLDRALERLAVEHARAARVVEMRFFAGLGEREIGEALGVAERTVKRDWAFARAWLLADLARNGR